MPGDDREAPATVRRPGRHADRSAVGQLGRWGVTTQHVTLVALVALALVALAAWWVLRSVPEPEPVQFANSRRLPDSVAAPPITPAAPMSAGAPPVSTPSGGAFVTPMPGPLVVDVAGKVRRPGIVELPAGSRVTDAIRSAGGVRPGVDTTALNLARLLIDGEQIVVGIDVPTPALVPSPVSTSGVSTSATIAPVNLNTATEEQLDTLPGIGPVTAASILAWRTENGAFTTVAELLEVSGIGDATLTT
ncbi:MAG: ComEA family DNA-binding protein [Nocardioidaceae bacterium]|nr:ComEA family DNA-binding protein [Nocardioidaceae bacterium]